MKTRAILHVDMDAFYASVEERDRPELKGKPVIVGGTGGRGVVAAANYVVRSFGVRSAMPISEALRRCPQAICIRPRMALYAKISEQVFEIFRAATPLVEGLSLDEAFLDVTASERLLGGPAAIAVEIRRRIRATTGLAASVGIAPNKLLAKIASDLAKPDGLFTIDRSNLHDVLDPLPVERLFGIGRKTLPRVHEAGIRSFADLRIAAEADLWQGLRQTWQDDAGPRERHRRSPRVRLARGAVDQCRRDLCERCSRPAPAARGVDPPRGPHCDAIARPSAARGHRRGQDPSQRLQDLYAPAQAWTRDHEHGGVRGCRLGTARGMAAPRSRARRYASWALASAICSRAARPTCSPRCRRSSPDWTPRSMISGAATAPAF